MNEPLFLSIEIIKNLSKELQFMSAIDQIIKYLALEPDEINMVVDWFKSKHEANL